MKVRELGAHGWTSSPSRAAAARSQSSWHLVFIRPQAWVAEPVNSMAGTAHRSLPDPGNLQGFQPC